MRDYEFATACTYFNDVEQIIFLNATVRKFTKYTSQAIQIFSKLEKSK